MTYIVTSPQTIKRLQSLLIKSVRPLSFQRNIGNGKSQQRKKQRNNTILHTITPILCQCAISTAFFISSASSAVLFTVSGV